MILGAHQSRRTASESQKRVVPLHDQMPIAVRVRDFVMLLLGSIMACGLSINPAVAAPQDTSARWIGATYLTDHHPQVVLFRKMVVIHAVQPRYPVYVSADNRFILYVNGIRVGEGPARGTPRHWRYAQFDLKPFLHKGANIIAARVWNFGNQAPVAQMSIRTGFLMWGASQATNAVNSNESWTARLDESHGPVSGDPPRIVGPAEFVRAGSEAEDWFGATPTGLWAPAIPLSRPRFASAQKAGSDNYNWQLVADRLPAMEYSPTDVGQVVRTAGIDAGGFPKVPLTVPARNHVIVLLDRQTLTTAYPELFASGGAGAKIRLTYAEALVDAKGLKGNRNDIAGKTIAPEMLYDDFYPDGGDRRQFQPLWWRTWRYLQIEVTTDEQPITLGGLKAFFSGYPLGEKATFDASDSNLKTMWDIGWRTVRVNAHETFMDGPYYEQLQYIGDARIQALIHYTVAGDGRLGKQAIETMAESAVASGLTRGLYPTADTKIIPPFSLLWIGMVHDYWWYRPNDGTAKAALPTMRRVLAWYAAHQRRDGLLGKLHFRNYSLWHYVDAPFESGGEPPEDADGGSVVEILQFVAALRDAAELEEAVGDKRRAVECRDRANRIADVVRRTAWDAKRGLLADTPAKTHFSQHANILGVMLDILPEAQQKVVLRTILADELVGKTGGSKSIGLTQASLYFRFYLARAIDHAGLGDLYTQLLQPWKDMQAVGLSTWPEGAEPTARSDAHAWSAHPNHDFLTIVAGIRPANSGFRRVEIRPQLGALTSVKASMPHPLGMITASYARDDGAFRATITLPPKLSGTFVWAGSRYPLHPGVQTIELPAPTATAMTPSAAPHSSP